MFRALMTVQWKWSRVAVLIATIIGFSIPVWSASAAASALLRGDTAIGVVGLMESFGIGYALLAAFAGLAMAVLAWSHDHAGRHIYALSLPLPRSRYAAMRFGAGLIFLLIPAAAVLVGSLVAVLILDVPSGLHAYPISLTLRYLFSSAVAFSLFFAIAAATQRAAAVILGTVAAVLVVAFVLAAASVRFDMLGMMGSLLFAEPGLLSVFTGRWALIDA